MSVSSDIDMTVAEAYVVLQVPKSSSLAEIRKKYLQLVLQNHPDRGGDAFVYRLVQHAYQLIQQSQREWRREDRDDRWATILDELHLRRGGEMKESDEQFVQIQNIQQFNQLLESRHHAPLLFENDPPELREARKQVLNGTQIGKEASTFILAEWKAPEDAMSSTTFSTHPVDVPRMIHTQISGQLPVTDIIEAFQDPPAPVEETQYQHSLISLEEIQTRRQQQESEFVMESKTSSVPLPDPSVPDIPQQEFDSILNQLHHRLLI